MYFRDLYNQFSSVVECFIFLISIYFHGKMLFTLIEIIYAASRILFFRNFKWNQIEVGLLDNFQFPQKQKIPENNRDFRKCDCVRSIGCMAL